MKKLIGCFLLLICFSVNIYASTENIALLEKGGVTAFTGTLYGSTVAATAFDGLTTGAQCNWYVTSDANIDASLYRVWNKKAKIQRIKFVTTGGGRAYEYEFWYWDLVAREWKELISVTGNSSSGPEHILDTPIITDKLSFRCTKAGADGNASMVGVYEIECYGELLDFDNPQPPPVPLNPIVERKSGSSAQLSWSDPSPDAWVPIFNIYRSTVQDFAPNLDSYVATVSGRSSQFKWEDKSCSLEKTYYKIASLGDYCVESEAIELSIPEVLDTENIALLTRGGEAIFHGTLLHNTLAENAFDGIDGNPQCIWDVTAPENIDKGLERIWERKVKIDRIGIYSTGNVAYEYRFLYWDLISRGWKELLYRNENPVSKPLHYLETPIITNKVYYVCIKAGKDGKGTANNFYQIYYYGEFVDNEPPLSPKNSKASRLSDSSAKITWSDPGPDSEGEPVIGFRIYKSTNEDFELNEDTLVADEEEFNTLEGATEFAWVDTDCSRIRYYYQIISLDELGDLSAPITIILSGTGSLRGEVQEEDREIITGVLKDVLVELFDEQNEKIGETHTDINGQYSFPYVVEGNYKLLFTKEGHFPVEKSFPVQPDTDHEVELTILVADRFPPLEPVEDEVNLTVIDRGVVTIFWEEPGPASDGDLPAWYNIYRSSTEIPDELETLELEQFKVAEGIEQKNWTDFEIPYTPVFYQVRSFDEAGNKSDKGLLIQVDVELAEIPKPIGLNNGATFERNSKASLTWQSIEDAASYEIEISEYEDFRELIDTIEITTNTNSTQWSDPAPEGRRFWRIRATYTNGAKSLFSEPAWFDTLDLGVHESREVRLLSVRPSYIPSAMGADLAEEFQIQLAMNEEAIVSLNIFDLRGRLVKSILSNQLLPVGIHTYPWNGKDTTSRILPNGLYILQLKLNLSGKTVTSVKRIGIFR